VILLGPDSDLYWYKP